LDSGFHESAVFAYLHRLGSDAANLIKDDDLFNGCSHLVLPSLLLMGCERAALLIGGPATCEESGLSGL
jgi:hypothetical protein